MTSAHLVPVLMAPLLAWRFYHRFKRSVGRQQFRSTRMTISIAFMALALGALSFSALPAPRTLWGLLGGAVTGLAVGYAGCRHTQFEVTEGGRFYTPHSHIGIALSILLFTRLAYRMFVLYAADDSLAAAAPAVGQSPLTMSVIGLTLGYYLAYQTLVVLRFAKETALAKVS